MPNSLQTLAGRDLADPAWSLWLGELAYAAHCREHVCAPDGAIVEALHPTGAWQVEYQCPEAAAPEPLDIEREKLNQALEDAAMVQLAPLVASMCLEEKPRNLAFERLKHFLLQSASHQAFVFAHFAHLSVSAGEGAAQNATSDETILGQTSAARFLAVADYAFRSDCPPAPMMAEGATSAAPGLEAPPLLQSLRKQNLPDYLKAVRGISEEPMEGLRQLHQIAAVMLAEMPKDCPKSSGLVEFYLFIAALNELPFRSRSLARRAFLACASELYTYAGLDRDPQLPSAKELMQMSMSQENLPGGGAGPLPGDLAGCLTAMHAGRWREWVLGGEFASSYTHPLWWPLVVSVDRVLTFRPRSPLNWAHALIPPRLLGGL